MLTELLLGCFLVAGAAAARDPVCGRTWKKVNKWRKRLREVGMLGTGAPELEFEEPVEATWQSPINMLADRDYDHLDLKYRDPQRLRRAHWSRGAHTKQLVKIQNGYLFPSGFIANATHRFDLNVINNINCVQSHLARNVGRENCYKTDWSSMIMIRNADGVTDPDDSSWLTTGVPRFSYQCESIPSAISLTDTQFADYGHFHETILTRLLWPAVQRLHDSVIIWRFKEQAFLKPWLNLMGLSWRQFRNMRKAEVVFKFDTLYVPAVVGMDLDFANHAEIVAHTPPADIRLVRGIALERSVSEDKQTEEASGDGAPTVLLLERGPNLRRGLSREDTLQLRRAAIALASAAKSTLVYIRGAEGGFELGKRAEGLESDIIWEPLSLSQGLLLFTRARAALGVHGSLFMHLFVAPPGAHVIDIQARHTYDLPVYHLCAVLGLHYWYHPVEGTHDSEILPLDAARLHKLVAKVVAEMKAVSHRALTEL